MADITVYDKRENYAEKVKPLLDRLEETCRSCGIPFFFTAAVENSESGTDYETLSFSALPMGIFLKDDKLVNHIKVAAGFEVIIPDRVPDIELS